MYYIKLEFENYYWSKTAQNWTTSEDEATKFDTMEAAKAEAAEAQNHARLPVEVVAIVA